MGFSHSPIHCPARDWNCFLFMLQWGIAHLPCLCPCRDSNSGYNRSLLPFKKILKGAQKMPVLKRTEVIISTIKLRHILKKRIGFFSLPEDFLFFKKEKLSVFLFPRGLFLFLKKEKGLMRGLCPWPLDYRG